MQLQGRSLRSKALFEALSLLGKIHAFREGARRGAVQLPAQAPAPNISAAGVPRTVHSDGSWSATTAQGPGAPGVIEVGREYDPIAGQWYRDLEADETFQVLSVDEDQELIEIQHLDGDLEDLDVDAWAELDVELTEEPEGWSGSPKAEAEADLDDDWDEDEDDWDEDEDDDEEDEDESRDDY